MSLTRKKAIDIMKKASGSKLEEQSVTEIPHGFVGVLTGKNQVICTTDGACAFADRLECTIDEYRYGVRIRFAEMNNKNSQALRFFLKWTAPSATGDKASIGFEDPFGLLLPVAALALAGEEIKPVLLSHLESPEKLAVAMGDAAWQALSAGLQGYGSEYAYAKTEQEVMNALLCGYTGIAIDVSSKLDLPVLSLSEQDLQSKFDKLNEDFKEALKHSYVGKKFTLEGLAEFSYTAQELMQTALCYGEAIAFMQYLYNAYFKGAPWPVDFIIYLGDAELPAKAHYLLANELTRAGIKLAAIQADSNSATFIENTHIASSFGHKLRLMLPDQLSEASKELLRSSAAQLDLRPTKGSGLLSVYELLKAKGSPVIDQLELKQQARQELLSKLADNLDTLKKELLLHKEAYYENFAQQIEMKKNLLK